MPKIGWMVTLPSGERCRSCRPQLGVGQEIDVLTISFAMGEQFSDEDIEAVHSIHEQSAQVAQGAEPILPAVRQIMGLEVGQVEVMNPLGAEELLTEIAESLGHFIHQADVLGSTLQ